MKPKQPRPSDISLSRKPRKKYRKPVLVKHGLLDAEAAAFSALY